MDYVDNLVTDLREHYSQGAEDLERATKALEEKRASEARKAFEKSHAGYTQALSVRVALSGMDEPETALARKRRREALAAYQDIEVRRERAASGVEQCASRQILAEQLAKQSRVYLAAGELWQAAQWLADALSYDTQNAQAREVSSQLARNGYDAPESVPLAREKKPHNPRFRWLVLVGLGLVFILLGFAFLIWLWQGAQA